VAAVSGTEPGGETVMLTRQPTPEKTPGQGSLPLNARPGRVRGRKSIGSEADTVSVTYIDADDGSGTRTSP